MALGKTSLKMSTSAGDWIEHTQEKCKLEFTIINSYMPYMLLGTELFKLSKTTLRYFKTKLVL